MWGGHEIDPGGCYSKQVPHPMPNVYGRGGEGLGNDEDSREIKESGGTRECNGDIVMRYGRDDSVGGRSLGGGGCASMDEAVEPDVSGLDMGMYECWSQYGSEMEVRDDVGVVEYGSTAGSEPGLQTDEESDVSMSGMEDDHGGEEGGQDNCHRPDEVEAPQLGGGEQIGPYKAGYWNARVLGRNGAKLMMLVGMIAQRHLDVICIVEAGHFENEGVPPDLLRSPIDGRLFTPSIHRPR